ncbi:hypothetical protein C7271_07740 [filamentous cyanobacterium CCP5]|nr:hypothetical protein C7271_07740 [filamentous cyanobacterium CCP5]
MTRSPGRVRTYVKTERVSYGQRVASSFEKLLIGVLLFLASFGLLFWNEMRVDLSQVAETAIAISAIGAPEADINDFVSITSNVTTQETLGDGLFLAPGNYVGLRRRSEMYAWEEDSQTDTTTHADGSETRRTTYTYRESWQEDPENSSNFERSREYHNPPKAISSETFHVNSASLGSYRLNFAGLTFPTPSGVPLNAGNLLPNTQAQPTGRYLFIGEGSLQNPAIGDLRIRYEALSNGTQATVLAALGIENTLKPHRGPRNVSIYRLFTGTREEAIATLVREHTIMTWSLRATGVFLMWMGMMLALEPLNVIVSIVPFLGNLIESATEAVTLLVALGLSGLTILTANILQNPIVLFLALGLGGFVVYRQLKQRRQPSIS